MRVRLCAQFEVVVPRPHQRTRTAPRAFAAAGAPEVRLVATRQAKPILRVSKQSFVVGSGSLADVQLCGDSVAAEHARFEWRNTRLFVTDLNSAQGTTYDGTCLVPGVAYAAGNDATIAFGSDPSNEYRLQFDVSRSPNSGGVEQALAHAFLARFQASGTAEVKQALNDQQL